MKALRKRARAGDVRMQLVLAHRLVDSERTTDRDEALRWMESAADVGDKDAINALCEWCETPRPLLSREQRERVMRLVEQAAYGDSTSAQFCLARLYGNGNGVEQDHVRAAQWFTKAAEQGHANAQYNLACCFAAGTGVEQDHARAVHWFSKAAEQGDPEHLLYAAGFLAGRHGESAGAGSACNPLVEPDLVRAVHYAARSAAQEWNGASDAREFINTRAHLRDVAREVCMACGTLASSVPKTKRCGGCQVAFFCSPGCLKTMWRVHKQHCAIWRVGAPDE